MSARNIYDYKTSLSDHFSTSYPTFLHYISFEVHTQQTRNKNWLSSMGKIKELMEEDYYAK